MWLGIISSIRQLSFHSLTKNFKTNNMGNNEGITSGVCANLGDRFHMGALIFRVIFIISLFSTFGMTLIVYIIMALLKRG